MDSTDGLFAPAASMSEISCAVSGAKSIGGGQCCVIGQENK